MQNPKSEILLISIQAELAGKYHSLRHFGGRFAPGAWTPVNIS